LTEEPVDNVVGNRDLEGMKTILWSGVLTVAACTAPTTIETNELDVVALDSHVVGDTFELRALDGNGTEVASVTRRIGAGGSEIVISIGEETVTGVTEAIGLVRMPPLEAPFATLLEIPSVSALLARDANLEVPRQPTITPTTPDSAYGTSSCPPSKLVNNGIVAQQCCYATANQYTGQLPYTMFRRPSDGSLSYRVEGPYTCSDASGNHNCMYQGWPAGMGCYYGPNHFTKASFWKYNTYVRISPNVSTVTDIANGAPPSNTQCTATWSSSPMTPYYPNVNGTAPMGTCDGVTGGDPAARWIY